MRVAASSPSQPLQPQKAEAQNPRLVKFRAKVKAAHPQRADAVWKEFRQVARALFGDSAFEPVPGESWERLSLGNAKLAQIAEHPGKVEKAIQRLQDQGKLPHDTRSWNAESAAKTYAHAARAVLPPKTTGSFTVETMNDDFVSPKSNLPKAKASVVLVQEAKNEVVRNRVPDGYGVHQNTHRKDQAGTAVTWKRKDVHADASGYALGVSHGHEKMLDRWINWTDVTVDGVKVRMISVHRPPLRFKNLWPAFDRNVAAFVKHTKLPVVIGMDSNEHGGPDALARATGLRWVGPKGSIDGFLVSPGVSVEKVWRLPKGTSDHQPVVARIHVRAKK